MFIEDHEIIIKTAILIHNSPDKFSKTVQNMILKIKCMVEKHLYIEEKLVYNDISIPENEKNYLIDTLINQHNEIYAEIKEIYLSIHEGKDYSVERFIELKRNHIKYEAEHLYDIFNKQINLEFKKKLYKEINLDECMGFYPINKLRQYVGLK